MKALVTGGGGFLGGAIVRQLIDRGVEVRSFARGEYPELSKLGVDVHRGDLADGEAVSNAVDGCDIVYHVAAKAGVWGPYKAYHEANITGTRHVIEACRKRGVSRLVFTSTPSVTFDGDDQQFIDESAPYAKRWLAHYPHTKAIAEQQVLGANCDALATVALRPHLIWGPGDNHLIPRILDRARRGKLRLIMEGKVSGLVDTTYIDNAADAHLLAGDQLMKDGSNATCAGKAYFITNDDPAPLVVVVNNILEACGQPPVTRAISPQFAYSIGSFFESVWPLLMLKSEPPMTKFVARQMSTAHWYNIGAAKRDLGYRPKVSIDEGLERLAASLNDPSAA